MGGQLRLKGTRHFPITSPTTNEANPIIPTGNFADLILEGKVTYLREKVTYLRLLAGEREEEI